MPATGSAYELNIIASKVVRATRPECQRVLAQSLILFCFWDARGVVDNSMVLRVLRLKDFPVGFLAPDLVR